MPVSRTEMHSLSNCPASLISWHLLFTYIYFLARKDREKKYVETFPFYWCPRRREKRFLPLKCTLISLVCLFICWFLSFKWSPWPGRSWRTDNAWPLCLFYNRRFDVACLLLIGEIGQHPSSVPFRFLGDRLSVCIEETQSLQYLQCFQFRPVIYYLSFLLFFLNPHRTHTTHFVLYGSTVASSCRKVLWLLSAQLSGMYMPTSSRCPSLEQRKQRREDGIVYVAVLIFSIAMMMETIAACNPPFGTDAKSQVMTIERKIHTHTRTQTDLFWWLGFCRIETIDADDCHCHLFSFLFASFPDPFLF